MTKTGYCPGCQQNVLLKREEMNIGLAIILFCFGCVGFIIYLFIHLSKPEDRCIHCGTQITISTQPTQQLDYQPQATQNLEEIKFCPSCGSKIDIKNLEFCPNCGFLVKNGL